MTGSVAANGHTEGASRLPDPASARWPVPGKEQASLTWDCCSFDEIGPRLLYDIMRLRQSIFIVEQDVPYADLDGKDFHCRHLTCRLNGELVAYLRLVPNGLFKPDSVSFGRVTVRRDLRGVGLGRAVVARGLDELDRTRHGVPIEISSQFYLMKFYRSFGFSEYGEQYIEDLLPHIAMRKA